MTRSQAEGIVEMLKSGRSFSTRFQEEEWGLEYLGVHEGFRKWSHAVYPDQEVSDAEILTEEQAVQLMMIYSHQTITAWIR